MPTRRQALALRAIAGFAWLLSGCSEDAGLPQQEGCDGSRFLVRPEDPAARGPWAVGARTVMVGGLTVELWYPAEPGSEVDQTAATYDLRPALPSSEQSKVPDERNPIQTCDCFRDLPIDAARGPFPVVFFMHGTGSFRTQSASLTTAWASRGFVVAAADHPGLGLADSLTRVGCPGSPPERDLKSDVETVRAAIESAEGDLSFLAERVDLSRIGLAGHSAGGAAVASLSDLPGAQVGLALAAREPIMGLHTVFLAGGSDRVVSSEDVSSAYEASPAPKHFVQLDGATHLSFSDICDVVNDAGENILEVAIDVGVCGVAFAASLFDCDASLPTSEARAINQYATTSVLEEVLQCRGSEDPLAMLQSRFEGVAVFESAR